MQVITYRITTVRVNDEPARDQAAEAQAASKDSASGAALLILARRPSQSSPASTHVQLVASSVCERVAPPLSAGNGGDRPDVPHAPADAEAQPSIASVQQSAAEQSAAAMAAANAEAAGAAAPGSDEARAAAAAAAAAPQGEARAAEQGGSDVAAAPAEDAPEKQEVSATRAGCCGSAGRRCRAVDTAGALATCTAVRCLRMCSRLLAGRCRAMTGGKLMRLGLHAGCAGDVDAAGVLRPRLAAAGY